MSSNTEKKTRFKRNGVIVVILFSIFSIELAVLFSSFLEPWETASSDLRMRLRYDMMESLSTKISKSDIILIGIDNKTQGKMGRFGSGKWLSRKSFFDQLLFFEENFSPTVLAYDIIFQDTQGSQARKYRISESGEKLEKIISKLSELLENPRVSLPVWVLDNLNKLSMEQGNDLMATRFASIMDNTKFISIIGYYFRGGVADPQQSITPWTDEDVFGNDESGDEDMGETIPYLKDISIPFVDIHFVKKNTCINYNYALNAGLPSRELLDYTILGFVNCPRDDDSIVRRLPLVLGFKYYNSITKREVRKFVPSFALTACLLHLGLQFPLNKGDVEIFFGKEIILHSPLRGDFHVPIDKDGRIYLNFNAKLKDFDSISFADIAPPFETLSPGRRKAIVSYYKDRIDNRIAMVGVTSAGIDVGAYPLSSDKPTPLIHIHLTAISNILNQNFLRPPERLGNNILMLVLFLIFTSLCLYENTARLGFTSLLFVVFYIVTSYIGVYFDIIILPLIAPLTYIGICSFSVLSYRFFTEERDKRRIRGMFSTMVSDKVLSYLEESPGSFSLQGHNVEASVFFSDVAGFTRISEQLSPEKLTELLNAYLTPVTDCILSHGGYLDKYVGDGIMAVWGAPYPDAEHAVKACCSALEQQEIIKNMNGFLLNKYGSEIHVRMGISSGVVTAGNMGSERKFQYTVMGDVVNISARLEPANKDFGTDIIVSEKTYLDAKDEMVFRSLGKIIVMGKKESISIYELVGEKGKVSSCDLEIISFHDKAINLFYRREWEESLSVIDSILDIRKDKIALHLKNRVLYYKDHPPDDTWRGEYIRTTKE